MPTAIPPASRRLRVVSDGTGRSTRVYDANGDLVKWGGAGLVKIEFKPIEPDGLVTAIFTVDFVALDLDVEQPETAAIVKGELST